MDAVKAGFLGGTLQIVFDMASPTKAEIESICNKNPLKIAYTVVDSVLFFCIPNQFKEEAKDFPSDYLVPIPQKYLREKGFTVEDGYVYIDVNYDRNFGVDISDKYYD